MRTAILLGCMLIAASINPTLDYGFVIRIFFGFVFLVFAYADTIDFLRRKKK